MKNKVLRAVIAIVLAAVLGVGGYFLGFQYKDKIPMENPIMINRITVKVEGADANDCAEMLNGDLIPNRLIENLMLLCSTEDLKASIKTEKIDDTYFAVEIPMEKEDNMAYFAVELSDILNEEFTKEYKNAKISIESEKEKKIDYEEKNSVKMAIAVCVLGAALGLTAGIVIPKLLTKKK